MGKERINIRLDKKHCEIGKSAIGGAISYNQFKVPSGVTYEGDDISGYNFYPMTVKEEGDYAYTYYPKGFNVELHKVNISSDGELLSTDIKYIKAEELSESLENRREKDINYEKTKTQEKEEITKKKEIKKEKEYEEEM